MLRFWTSLHGKNFAGWASQYFCIRLCIPHNLTTVVYRVSLQIGCFSSAFLWPGLYSLISILFFFKKESFDQSIEIISSEVFFLFFLLCLLLCLHFYRLISLFFTEIIYILKVPYFPFFSESATSFTMMLYWICSNDSPLLCQI